MTAHSLVRFKGSLVNTPHLIEQNSFNSIMEYINQRTEGNAALAPEVKAEEDWLGSARYYDESKTGVMYIDGPLTYKSTGWEAFCGGTSYQMLKEQMNEMVDNGAKTVAWICSSGGGEAFGMMDTANYLRKLADDNGIKIIAFVEGMAASACYGLACVADEIVMTKDSQVGSIGVLIQLMNNSKALEKQGYERTFITAGADKVPFDKDGAFTEGFLERLQDQVDTLYEEFTTHVATNRSLSVEAVKNTEANVFLSTDAIALGLADQVMTVEGFYEYLAESAQSNLEGGTMRNPLDRIFKANANTQLEETTDMAQLEELQAQLSAAQEQIAGMTELSTKFAEMQATFAAQAEQLEQAKQALAEMETAKAEALVASRKAALSEVLPVDQVEANYAALSSLDESAFNVIVGQFKAAKDARAESFKAVGSEGVEKDEEELVDAAEAIRLAGVARAKAMRK